MRSGTSLPASISAWFFKKDISNVIILLTNQILLPAYLYFLRYWAICILQLFDVQFVISQAMELILAFLSIRFPWWTKSQDKNKKSF